LCFSGACEEVKKFLYKFLFSSISQCQKESFLHPIDVVILTSLFAINCVATFSFPELRIFPKENVLALERGENYQRGVEILTDFR